MVHGNLVCGEVCPVAQYFHLHHSGWFVERCAMWLSTSFSTTQGLYPVVLVWKDGICEKLMWAESLCTTHLNILGESDVRRLTGVLTHLNGLEEFDASRLTYELTHFTVLEESDGSKFTGVVVTSSFLKSDVGSLARVLLTSEFDACRLARVLLTSEFDACRLANVLLTSKLLKSLMCADSLKCYLPQHS